MILRQILLASLLLAPLPAAASSIAIAPQTIPASLSADAALGRFYLSPARAPLWMASGSLTPAGQIILDRLRTADGEGYAEGPGLAARIDAARLAPTPNALTVDRLLSAGWLGLVAALKGPIEGARYFNPATLPPTELPDRTLSLASQSTDRVAYVTAAMRKSRFYEELHDAMLADAAAHGGRIDPRLAANLQRARILPTSGRYLIVNPAAAQLMLVENGQVIDKMRVVVGKPETPTYPMASRIYFAVLNPYWNVAEDLVRKIVAPHIVSDGAAYLKRTNYEAVDQFGQGATVIPWQSINWKDVVAGKTEVKMRQKPSKLNSMGQMKFPFANDFGIFLHDTSNKPQFAEDKRDKSNGCIRLEDAPRLARWLFGTTPPTASGAVPDETVRLPQPMEVYVAYLTAQPQGGSNVAWNKDVYSLDPAAVTAAASATAAASL